MTISQRVAIATMSIHRYFRPFTVMEILAAVNKTPPRITVQQVVRALCDMTRRGKLTQRALGVYEWVK